MIKILQIPLFSVFRTYNQYFLGSLYSVPYDGTGRKNYERAIEKGINYGFDLKNPADSFINTFHLKKHDVKGLRIYLELKPIKLDLPGEEKARKHGYTTRAPRARFFFATLWG
jgi:hypothetical protein